MNDDPSDSIKELVFDSDNAFHIGAIIRDRLAHDRRSISWFASQMNCDRSNMYKLLSRAHLDTNFILRASKVLEHNFFQDISDILQTATESGWGNVYIS